MVAGGPAEPVHQDPGDRGGPARDHPVPVRGHQRQRHADLLAGALRRGHRRVHGGPGAGCRSRARPVGHRVGGVVLRQPGRHRGGRAGWTRSARPRRTRCAARPRIANARLAYELFEQQFASPTGGRRWQARGAKPQRPLWASTSVEGPVRSRTPCTWWTWSRRTPSTRCPRRRCTRPPSTASCAATPSTAPTTQSRQRVRPSSQRSGVSYDDVVQVLEDEGVQKFAVSWHELLETIKTEMAASR